MSDNQQPSNGLRLKTLLKETGFKSTRLDASRRLVGFPGRTREWMFVANIYNDWLHIQTYVCEIPTAPGLRAELLDAAMVANHTSSLTKLVKNSAALVLELEYRAEHVDAQVLSNLFSLILANAEEYYPRLFRIVSGDAVLESLATAALPSIA